MSIKNTTTINVDTLCTTTINKTVVYLCVLQSVQSADLITMWTNLMCSAEAKLFSVHQHYLSYSYNLI